MWLALLLTLIAGSATIIGGFLGVNKRVIAKIPISVVLAFAAGAMICVSVIDLLPEAMDSLSSHLGVNTALAACAVAVAIGAAIVYVIDSLLPHSNSVRCANKLSNDCGKQNIIGRAKLLRSGMIIAAIMAAHNIPEGIVTFTGTLHDTSLGVSLALAIALHNIPEGIAIASPIYAATKNRVKAISYTTVAALAEPVGAFVAYLFVVRTIPQHLFGLIFAATAGMMLYISATELLPSARLNAIRRRHPNIGMTSGFATMAMSIFVINIL